VPQGKQWPSRDGRRFPSDEVGFLWGPWKNKYD